MGIDRSTKTFDDGNDMRRYAFEAVLIHLLWFAVLFLSTDGLTTSWLEWLKSFDQWDVRWYSTIAMSGHGLLPQSFVFPPGHSWMFGAVTDAIFALTQTLDLGIYRIHIFYHVALVISLTCFALANMFLVRLAQNRWNISRKTLWLAAISNPMGYFAVTAYSDTVFFVLFLTVFALSVWTSDERERWGFPPIEGRKSQFVRATFIATLFLVPWFRLTGFAFAVLALRKRFEVIATFVSLAAFLTYYWIRTGDPLFFLAAQRVFEMPEGHLLNGFMYAVSVLAQGASGIAAKGIDFFIYWSNFAALPLGAFFVSIVFAVWLWRRGEKSLALLVLAITFMSHNQAFWRSTMRYVLPFYPMFYWMWLTEPASRVLGKITPRVLTGLAVGSGFFLQIFYARVFRSGGWAF